MKNILIIMSIFLVSISISMIFYFGFPDFVSGSEMNWEYKEKEVKSRLFSVPILLYHNIDGSGPFSIEYKALRSHFQIIKDRNIKVIPLKNLISQIENSRPYKEKVLVITFDDGYPAMYHKLISLIKEFKFPITLFIYTDFIELKSKNQLTWKLLRKMEKLGVDIQAHTKSHMDLTLISMKDDLESKKKLFEEIYLSKKIIELYLDKEIDYFAFPYGRYDLKLVDLSSFSDYKRVFSTDYGSNILTRDNYCLKRQHIKSNYSISFIDRLIR